jgi:uncharacterized protein
MRYFMPPRDRLRLSIYVSVSPAFTEEVGLPVRLLLAIKTGKVLRVPEASWASLEAGHLQQLSDEFLLQLIADEILVSLDIDELDQILSENQEAIETSRLLYHVIQPTAACQMGCEYCGQKHSKKNLSSLDQASVIQHLKSKLQLRRFRKLEIGWFGGEPLLAIDVMRKLSPELVQLAIENRCDYSSRIVTNGLLLTPQIATELHSVHHVRSIEVTLDGLAPHHDRQRPMKKGRATFSKIFENILAVAQVDCAHRALKIRCNVTRQNATDVPDFIRFLADHGLQKKILIYFAPVHSWGNDAHLGSLSLADFAHLEMEWLALLLEYGFEVALLPERKKIVCLAVQPNAEVTDAFGELHSCSEIPYVQGYQGAYSLGTQQSPLKYHGPLAKRLRNFNQEIKSQSYGCASCFLLPVCGGQCPKQWIEGTAPCPSVKHNLPERLLLAYANAKRSPIASKS